MNKTNDYPSVTTKDPEAVTIHENVLKQSEDLPNLFTYHGSIQNYAEEHGQFDIGLGLHACGEATDLVLRACGKAKANFVVSPCCVGKLKKKKRNPYIYHATAANEATISYPQSSMFCTIIPKGEKFDALAKAADYGEMENLRTPRNASRRTAKSLLEMDRLLYMKETYGYDDVVGLFARFFHWLRLSCSQAARRVYARRSLPTRTCGSERTRPDRPLKNNNMVDHLLQPPFLDL